MLVSPALAQEECYTVDNFVEQTQVFGDPLPTQVDKKHIVPLVASINKILSTDIGPVTKEQADTVWYTFTVYPMRGITAVIGFFDKEGCHQRMIIAPPAALYDVINDPSAGSL